MSKKTKKKTISQTGSKGAGEQPTWQTKVKVAKEAQEAGKALREGRPKVFTERRLSSSR